MSAAIRALVALDAGVDRATVEAALPPESQIHVVGVVDGLDQSWTILEETPTDLLLVACSGYSDRAIVLVDGAVRAEEIDVEQARREAEEARAALEQAESRDGEPDRWQLEQRLRHAENKIGVAGRG